jgi:hypothetical protein
LLDLEKARQPWTFLPFKKTKLPTVKQSGWVVNEIGRNADSRAHTEREILTPSVEIRVVNPYSFS